VVYVQTFLSVLPELCGLRNITCANTDKTVVNTNTSMNSNGNVNMIPQNAKQLDSSTFMVLVFLNAT